MSVFTGLHKEMFFIVDINIFCFHTSKNRYYPAEIAVAGFNLEEGVNDNNVFHRMIKPGMYICILFFYTTL